MYVKKIMISCDKQLMLDKNYFEIQFFEKLCFSEFEYVYNKSEKFFQKFIIKYEILQMLYYQNQMLNNKEKIDEFLIQKKIGEGFLGNVYLGQSETGTVAIKKYSLENLVLAKKQFILMKGLKHDNIIKVYQYRPHSKHLFENGEEETCGIITMEFAQNGQIFDLIKKLDRFSEMITRTFFKLIIETVEYLHKSGIAHLDIKLENLLLDKNFDLKFVDFGFSTNKNHIIDAYIGTPGYMAPEIESRKKFNAFQADLFACGVVLFMMKIGLTPFHNTQTTNMEYQMLNSEKYRYRYWRYFQEEIGQIELSKSFKDLIQKMLCNTIQKRLTINQIKEHPWYKQATYSKAELKEILKKVFD